MSAQNADGSATLFSCGTEAFWQVASFLTAIGEKSTHIWWFDKYLYVVDSRPSNAMRCAVELHTDYAPTQFPLRMDVDKEFLKQVGKDKDRHCVELRILPNGMYELHRMRDSFTSIDAVSVTPTPAPDDMECAQLMAALFDREICDAPIYRVIPQIGNNVCKMLAKLFPPYCTFRFLTVQHSGQPRPEHLWPLRITITPPTGVEIICAPHGDMDEVNDQ